MEPEKIIEVTLRSGLVIRGTVDQVIELTKKLGEKMPVGYYLSASRGWIPISEMATLHLRNAILKRYRDWVASLSTSGLDNKGLVDAILNGLTDSDFVYMLQELKRRFD